MNMCFRFHRIFSTWPGMCIICPVIFKQLWIYWFTSGWRLRWDKGRWKAKGIVSSPLTPVSFKAGSLAPRVTRQCHPSLQALSGTEFITMERKDTYCSGPDSALERFLFRKGYHPGDHTDCESPCTLFIVVVLFCSQHSSLVCSSTDQHSEP